MKDRNVIAEEWVDDIKESGEILVDFLRKCYSL